MSVATFLLQAQPNTKHLLSFFHVTAAGLLTDAFAVEFRATEPDGTEDTGWTDVTTGDANFDEGAYYAHDGTSPWAPAADAEVGTWTCHWRWKATSSDSWSTWDQPFEVVSSTFGTRFGYRTLISPAQVRAEGVSAATLSDSRLAMLMELAQGIIEERTQQFFRPVHTELRMNAVFSEAMFFPVPVIGLEHVKANGSSTALNQRSYRVNHARIDEDHRYRPPNDPRRNPWVRFAGDVSIYSAQGSAGSSNDPRFMPGGNLQVAKGVFGFLETDGSCPALITYAMLRLIYGNTTAMSVGAGGGVAGPVLSKAVDRHSVTYAQSAAATGLKHALLVSKQVEEILINYRRPIKVATTAPTWPLPLVGS